MVVNLLNRKNGMKKMVDTEGLWSPLILITYILIIKLTDLINRLKLIVNYLNELKLVVNNRKLVVNILC